MDLMLFTQWAGAIGLALGIINMAWNLAGRAAKPVADKLKGIDDRLNNYRVDLIAHDRRIQDVENELKHQPTSNQVTELRVTAERLDGHVKRLDETVNSLAHTVRRIDDYLREKG